MKRANFLVQIKIANLNLNKSYKMKSEFLPKTKKYMHVKLFYIVMEESSIHMKFYTWCLQGSPGV